MDIVLVIIASLLIVSLGGYLMGLFIYPYGIFILLIFFIARLIHLNNIK